MMNDMPTANGNGSTPCPRNLPQHFNGCSCVAIPGPRTATAEVDIDLMDPSGMTALMDAENAANGAYDPPVSTQQALLDMVTDPRVNGVDLTEFTDSVRIVGASNPEDDYSDEVDPAVVAAEHARKMLDDDFALTDAEAYEMNRAQAISALARYDDADPADAPARRVELAMSALAVSSNLRVTYTDLDEKGQQAADRLDLALKVADQADLKVEWDAAFADLKAAGIEHDADHPIAERYRQASNDVNHANRRLDHAIATGQARSTDPVAATEGVADALRGAIAVGDANIRTYGGKTAAQWREQARGGRQRSAESFARSDTDGYLSQWASDTMARKYDACADLAEQGGKAEFNALFDTDGNLVPAREVQTKFGRSWVLLDANGDSTGQFVNPSKAKTAEKRNAAMAKKGYAEGTIRTDAVVRMSDGMMPSPYFDRANRAFDPNVEVVSTIDDGPDWD
jgi:hypothetical protein